MQIRRGDIWYIEKRRCVGSEQQAGRPAIIVSNDKNNMFSTTVEVVYLTTQPKTDLPTHVLIRSMVNESTALCEQITTVAKERLGTFYGHLTDKELAEINKAMRVSLALRHP